MFFFLKNRTFLCATSTKNMVAFLGLVAGALLLGRYFCSWVCPVGLVQEMLSRFGRWVGIQWQGFWKGPARVFRFGGFVVLALVLYYTHTVADLIFRPYCPYYVVFTGEDHELAWWSKWLMAGLFVASCVIPFLWCKMLCPLGAFLRLPQFFSATKIGVKPNACIPCGACEKKCPQGLAPFKHDLERDTDCTMCLECVHSCPRQALAPHLSFTKTPYPVSRFMAGIFGVFVLVAIGIHAWVIPTFVKKYDRPGIGVTKPVELFIEGLHCRGTAMTLAKMLESLPGVAGFAAYSESGKIVADYDGGRTPVASIEARIDGGFKGKDPKTGEIRDYVPFQVKRK
jgi:polyferredoxin